MFLLLSCGLHLPTASSREQDLNNTSFLLQTASTASWILHAGIFLCIVPCMLTTQFTKPPRMCIFQRVHQVQRVRSASCPQSWSLFSTTVSVILVMCLWIVDERSFLCPSESYRPHIKTKQKHILKSQCEEILLPTPLPSSWALPSV